MSKDYALYETINMSQNELPIIFNKYNLSRNGRLNSFPRHWHEKIEFLYFTGGEALIICNAEHIKVKEGDFIVINSNELHEGYALSDKLDYYCIIVDTMLFQARHIDICEAKYISPIYQNRILFENKIEADENIKQCIENIVKEFDTKNIGFEISIKSLIYQLIVILLRNYVKVVLTTREYNSRMKELHRFNKVLQYIEDNYNKDISIDSLSSMMNLNKFYFCHLFKKITGKTFNEHLNIVRINKAEEMLRKSDMNITEIALGCGYNDANYFSRVFKKYNKVSPSEFLNNENG